MSLQLIFVVETNKTCKSDWIYIKDTIDYFFEYDRTAIKLTPVYMDGKGKYKNKEKEISKNIAAYKAGGKGRQTKVIYCFDCDDYNTKQEDAFFLEKVRQYCAEQKYDFVWFCKDIERVYTGKKVNAVDKKKKSEEFKKKKQISEVKVDKLSAAEYQENTSNIYINQICNEMLILCRFRKEPGLSDYLIALYNTMYLHKLKLNKKTIKLMSAALTELAEWSDYSNLDEDVEEKIKNIIDIRKNSAGLANQLYLYEEGENIEHSKGALIWKEICRGEKSCVEFSEVKNNWY